VLNNTYDMSELKWNLTGWLPHLWKLGNPVESAAAQAAEVHPVPTTVPSSVQKSLLDAGIIEDWNKGTYYRDCQWVENLHWIYETNIPIEWTSAHKNARLDCLGLDGSGWVFLNKKQIGSFGSSFVPYSIDLTEHLTAESNLLQIVFDCPPRWLGQFGYTSQMTDLKTRFYYTWDWTSRIVQTGISDAVNLICYDNAQISNFRATTSVDAGKGCVMAAGVVAAASDSSVRISVTSDKKQIAQKTVSAVAFNATGISIDNLDVDLWWPNLHGEQPVYELKVELLDAAGTAIDTTTRRIGFRTVEWRQCEGAPEGADPWICAVNDKPIFLQGANWVPIRPNYADVTEADYHKRLELYKNLGFNIMRVWGGAVLEKELFYNICDELGILVWQEFPLSSSGLDNYPPEDELFIKRMTDIARSYITRRQHHPSLIMWCGGNELINKDYTPVGEEHPMLKALADVVRQNDPSRRYVPTSPSGPKCHGSTDDYGKGLHWDVHGPWNHEGSFEEWETYWHTDDSLFRSETGSPGASAADILEEFAGNCSVWPIDATNPYWRRHTTWWIDYPKFVAETGNEDKDLVAYSNWSQERQRRLLHIAVSASKNRFPACGGIILWMGHDCFPCSANTSVIDYYGRPKSAALDIGEIFNTGN